LFRPTLNQKLWVRGSNIKRLRICSPLQAPAVARSGAQYRIDDRMLAFWRQVDRFVNRRMFGRLCDKQLIETDAQNVAKIDVHASVSKLVDPKVQECAIAQDAVKEFDGECSIGGVERRLGEHAGNDRVGELLLSTPVSQRGESDSASRDPRHNEF